MWVWCLVFGVWCLVFGVLCLVFSVWCWCLGIGVGRLVSVVWCLVFGVETLRGDAITAGVVPHPTPYTFTLHTNHYTLHPTPHPAVMNTVKRNGTRRYRLQSVMRDVNPGPLENARTSILHVGSYNRNVSHNDLYQDKVIQPRLILARNGCNGIQNAHL